jgi:hypothetical protein
MRQSDPGETRGTRLFVVIVLVLGGLLTHGSYAGTGDAPHYLVILHSLAFDGDLDLSNNYGASEPLIADGGLAPELHVRWEPGGVARPVHDIGMPLLFVPYARIAVPAVSRLAPRAPALMRRLHLTPGVLYRNLIAVPMILLAGLLGIQMLQAFVAAGSSTRIAFWTALLVALSPPLLIYGILFFTELLSALIGFVVFRAIALDDHPKPPVVWAPAGAAAGALLLVHIRNAGLVAGLMVVALHEAWRRRAPREAAAFAMSLGAPVIVRTAINDRLWGTWFATPIAHGAPWDGLGAQLGTALTRLGGMFLDQEFGLLPYAPVLLLAVLGFVLMARTRPTLALRIAAVAGSYLLLILLPITNWVGWTAGWSPAARFLVPIVPMLALGVAAAIPATPRAILIPILALQVAIDAYVWQHPKVLWNDGDGVAAICERETSRICRFLPSFVVKE